MQQLLMIYPPARGMPAWATPPDYALRSYREGQDDEAMTELMHSAGFADWGHEHLREVRRSALPRGGIFAIHLPSGSVAASAVASHRPTAEYPFGAEMGWLACAPDHRGRGLGYVVTAAATRRMLESHYKDIYLLTDDFRLAAIKTYLNMGWLPVMHDHDMPERWRKLRMAIGLPEEV